MLVVQGGPGTGKTVVALHRAAYLLYTYRFPLEDQGVLVIGPNRVFLRYIERVLPSLGEAGVEQVVLNDLVHDVEWARYGVDPADGRAHGHGEGRPAHGRRHRQGRHRPRACRSARTSWCRSAPASCACAPRRRVRIVRRPRSAGSAATTPPASGSRARSGRRWPPPGATASSRLARSRTSSASLPEVRTALERMWPVLTPAELLHDLFGSKALLQARRRRSSSPRTSTCRCTARARADVDEVRWTDNDVALLDEARDYLGPRPARKGKPAEDEEIRTYGHIVIDEVQDLTPMQLRMASRRSLNGSMTVVGDIAQATGALAPDDWDDILAHLPDNKPSRVIGLSVGYRIPDADHGAWPTGS